MNSHSFKSLRSKLTLALSTAISASATCVVFMLPNSAFAQEGTAGALLEEIVTTARKRSNAEAVQDVPIAITAYGAGQLEALFVKKLDDLSYVMPNVQLEAVGTFPGVQNFSIRGQGINSSIPSVDPTVGVFVDGVYMGTTYGVVIDTFDLESVEVLRGPQGLLFGRNVTGGAVVIRNARPTGEAGVRFRVGANDGDQYNVAAAIEGSLVDDKLAGKLVAYYDDDQGYFDGTTIGRDVGKFTTKLARGTLVWTPSDDIDWTVSVESGESKGDGALWTSVTAQRAGAQADFLTTANDPGFTDMKWHQGVIETNVANVGNGTLTNILGMRRVSAESATDVDGISAPIFFVPGTTSQHQLSNELRWSGSVNDSWDTTIGFYYFDQDVSYREGRVIQVALLRALGGDMDAKNFGVFWNNEFQINDSLSMQLGLRYTDESKSAQIISGVGGGCADIVAFNCTFDNLTGDWDNVTPKIGFQYRPDDTSQVYAFWSKGFRSGGFNFRNAKPNVIPPGPTNEEENVTVEFGYKGDFFDGRLRVNAALFRNEVEGMQRELNIGDPDVVVLQGTINAGDVVLRGVELDVIALLTDNFSINASYGHQDGKYESVNPAFEAFLGPELPRLAPNSYNLGFSLDVPAGAGLVNFAANYSFRERHPYNDSNTEFFEDQKRVNAAVNWFLPNEAWQVSLYGKNLTDEANWGNLTSISGLYTAGPMQKGRIVGVEVNFRR